MEDKKIFYILVTLIVILVIVNSYFVYSTVQFDDGGNREEADQEEGMQIPEGESLEPMRDSEHLLSGHVKEIRGDIGTFPTNFDAEVVLGENFIHPFGQIESLERTFVVHSETEVYTGPGVAGGEQSPASFEDLEEGDEFIAAVNPAATEIFENDSFVINNMKIVEEEE